MKKITTKLGIITFLGLGIVAYGQYDGKVGVNTDKPKATLEVKAITGNSNNTREGLLIPRVSINKALLMGQNLNNPVEESTLIYVNDLDDYTVEPADTKVADITEKGYYYWNGDKWVKPSGHTYKNEPTQFYMPSIILPTNPDDRPGYVSYSTTTGFYTINLHEVYKTQFTSPVIKSSTTASLKTYENNELEYFVTYSDNTVYTNLELSDVGILKYKVVSNPNVTEKTYMNIVLKVK